jgi:hypothetical protein
MFSVPGNRYSAIEFLASDAGADIRREVGVSPVEHEAICRMAEHSEMWRAYSVACSETQSSEEESAICIPKPNGVQFRDNCDGEFSWVYGLVCVRMQINTGCGSVNMSVTTNDSAEWPLSNLAAKS